ncbi:hypothetical protein LHFGNBLO_006013 (plasmid) [Mesorhizobium sp. AR10]|uniref:hypothetical protein n=1 Tax=Mesorhizobium sp. AR10 TaxID=2865839 RepID=UPI00215E837D|nr:hypothetical protein [Mesorhizobium sp. AR10]UVK35799.1 hypothetical protein LHFGNBLO_006013 [Mesorhizobium sp. AR10]
MEGQDRVYLSLSPQVAAFLTDNDIDIAELLAKAKVDARITLGEDPATVGLGHKEPATIILASAAAIAIATPLLRELIRNISGKTPVIRERQLVQVKDAEDKSAFDANGNPIMEWRETERSNVGADKVVVKGFGIEISFESN